MAKFVLLAEDDYEFDLYGISCHSKNYKLCWEINDTMTLGLERCEDLQLPFQKEAVSYHPRFEFIDEENHVEYYVLENLGSESYLAPEMKEADFFLMVKGAYAQLDVNIREQLMKIGNVLASFKVQPETLKSKQNFLF